MTDFLNNLFSLKGKTVIITGASRGIGFQLADDMSAAGGDVFAIARSEEPASQFKNGVKYLSCDVNNNKKFTKICEQIFKDQGSVDVLVNCAGISVSLDSNGKSNNFQKIIEVNLTAAYHSIISVSEFMKTTGGSIINITSLASLQGMPGNPGYVASKGGLSALTRGLAIDLAGDNIRVNNIVPGYILTDMTRQSYSDKKLREQRDKRMILDRWGKPEDLTGAVILLASDASGYITGTDIVVDGGWTAKGL